MSSDSQSLRRWVVVVGIVAVCGAAVLASRQRRELQEGSAQATETRRAARGSHLRVSGAHRARATASSARASSTPSMGSNAGATQAAVPADWQAIVQERIEASQYAIRPEGHAFAAANRVQGFRMRFDGRGVELARHDGTGRSLRIGGGSIGRGGRGASLREGRPEPGECRADGAVDERGECLRVLAVERGGATEVWENRREGLEHSFVVERAPRGEGPLEVVVEVEGASVSVSAGGDEARIAQRGGTLSLRYSGLVVLDATGRELAASMKARGGAIAIVVEDARARYPVRIDPLLTSVAWTAEGDQMRAYFGTSVSSAGDVNGDGYGDVVVGAPGDYDLSSSTEGRAYLFLGSASGLGTTASWITESDQSNANFGISVSTAGDVNGDGYGEVLVGAPGFSNGQSAEGRAYLYLGSATGLGTTPTWSGESNQASAALGRAVSTAGDVNADGYGDVVVGAPGFSNGQASEGRGFLYLGSATGLGTTAGWGAESDQASAGFGTSVANAGDVNGDGYADVLLGAAQSTNGASVYLGGPTGLGTNPSWTGPSNQAGSYFGNFVSSAGDVNADGYGDVVVGEHGYSNGETFEGRASVYLGSAAGLGTTVSWSVESNQDNGRLGGSVSTAGDVNGDGYGDVVVGVPRYSNGQTDEGRAYVYLGSATGLGTIPGWTAESDQANAKFGWSVSSAGDVNGDGLNFPPPSGQSDYAAIAGAWLFSSNSIGLT